MGGEASRRSCAEADPGAPAHRSIGVLAREPSFALHFSAVPALGKRGPRARVSSMRAGDR
jgi:hypothetical protein